MEQNWPWLVTPPGLSESEAVCAAEQLGRGEARGACRLDVEPETVATPAPAESHRFPLEGSLGGAALEAERSAHRLAGEPLDAARSGDLDRPAVPGDVHGLPDDGPDLGT